MAVYSNAKPILPQHGSLVLTDATSPSAKTMTVPFTSAVDLGAVKKGGRSWKTHRNRGKNIAVTETGDLESTVIKCKVQVPILTHATDYTVLDWIRRTGALTGLTSTLPDDAGGDEVFAYKAKFLVDRADFGTDPSIEYNYAIIEVDDIAEGGSDEEPMMASLTLTCIHYGDDETDWMTVT